MTDREREELLAEGRVIMYDLWSELNEAMSVYRGRPGERSLTNALDIEFAVALYARKILKRLEDQNFVITKLEEALEAVKERFGLS